MIQSSKHPFKLLKKYLSFVKFSHSVFALPFAMVSFTFATIEVGYFDWLLLVKIVVAMVAARSAAMGFNRWADSDIDAKNPRTARREIPTGAISSGSALWFVALCSVFFVAAAFWINNLCGWLSPVALLFLLGYSYTKRFSAMSHFVLGIAQAIAPVGVYLAVKGGMGYDMNSLYSLLLGAVVLTWMAGFDILYALQDVEADRQQKLYSLPSRTSPQTATTISIITHAVSFYGVILLGQLFGGGKLYWFGTALFAVVLVVQHLLYTPKRAYRCGKTFGLINGLASVVYAAFAIMDMIL